MAVATHNVWFLGNLPIVDTNEATAGHENAAALIGTYGGAGAPMSTQVFDINSNDADNSGFLVEDTNDALNASSTTDNFVYDLGGGSTTQTLEAMVYHSVTATFADGSTGSFNMWSIQMENGDTFLLTNDPAYEPAMAAFATNPVISFAINTANTAPYNMAQGFHGSFAIAEGDGTVTGTAGDDVIDASYVDPTDGEMVDNNDGMAGTTGDQDVINGWAGDDTIAGGAAADTIDGGTGDDTITGGAGDDVIYGDTETPPASVSESMNWNAQGSSGTDLTGGFVQDTGSVQVQVTVTNDGGLNEATVDGATQYTESGEPFATNSAIQLGGAGNGGSGVSDTATITMDFETEADSGFGAGVENVQFRINDIDQSSWDDLVTVTAIGIDGLPTTVTYTISGDETLINGGQTIDGAGDDSQDLAGGSVLVTVVGPVQSISIDYDNAGTGGQALWITDVHFDTIAEDAAGNDSLSGDAGDDLIYGYAGDDTIDGGDGADSLLGGDGNDSISGGAGYNSVDGGAGNDIIVGGDDGNDLRGGDGADTITGGASDDVLLGGEGDDSLSGGGGDDVLDDGFGIDQGQGNDTFSGGDGNDQLYSGLGDDVLYGDAGDDTLLGEEGNDTLYGGTGNDSLDGSIGDDTLFGQDGNDTLVGSDGADYLDGDSGDDTLLGEDGQDVLVGDDGNDTLLGGADNDQIYASSGNNSVDGGSGNDVVFMGTGDDLIAGGVGSDTLSGAAGDDIFYGGDGPSGGAPAMLDWSTVSLTNGDGTTTVSDGTDSVGVTITGEGSINGSFFPEDSFRPVGDVSAENSTLLEFDEPIQDLSFLIYGVEESIGNWDDQVTIIALDANGNQVPVTFSQLTHQTVNGNTIEGDGDAGDNVDNQIQVNVAAPIVSLEIVIAPGPDDDTWGGIGIGDMNFAISDGFVDDEAADTMTGGEGDDTFYAGSNDVVTGGEDVGDGDVDTLVVQDVDYIDYATGNPEAGTVYFDDGSTMTFSEIENVVVEDRDGTVSGTSGDDLINGSYVGDPDGDLVDANDQILAGAETDDDLIEAGAGNDTVQAGGGDDLVFAGTGDDIIDGGSGDDTLYGEEGDDTFLIGAGVGIDEIVGGEDLGNGDTDTLDFSGITTTGVDVTLTSQEGGDYNMISTTGQGDFSEIEEFILTDQDDIFDAAIAPGGVSIDGADGDDTLVGSSSADTFVGGEGNDTLNANEGDDILDGGAGDDVIHGDEGSDTITAGEGADYINGGDDDDLIFAGAGDIVDGGDGGLDDDTLDLTGSVASGGSYVLSKSTDSDGNGFDGTVTYYDAGGSQTGTLTFTNIESIVPCFTPGTLITTLRGQVPVERLLRGDRVLTRDHGFQVVEWIGQKDLSAAEVARRPELRPIKISQGALGDGLPERDLIVSPQHRILVSSYAAEMWFGETEVLVAAKHLTCLDGVEVMAAADVSYIHFMCARHEIVLSDGSWSESFQPGDMTLSGLDSEARAELLALFPELCSDDSVNAYISARMTLKAHEARLLF